MAVPYLKRCATLAVFLHLAIFGVHSLRDIHIKVPEAVPVGEAVTLECSYDLEQHALYTIKWYRNDLEFYRFVPKESPPHQVFIVDHIHVDTSRSDSRKVTLTDVERETSAEFKCEVSADAPLFHTEIREAHLLVADVPEGGVNVTSHVSKNSTPDAVINADCTTPRSHPAMNVTWFLNDQEMRPNSVGISIQKSINKSERRPTLYSVQSKITIKYVPDLFKNGKLKLGCVGTLFSLYKRSDETYIEDITPLYAPVMAHTTPSAEGMNAAFHPIPLLSTPLGLSFLLVMVNS